MGRTSRSAATATVLTSPRKGSRMTCRGTASKKTCRSGGMMGSGASAPRAITGAPSCTARLECVRLGALLAPKRLRAEAHALRTLPSAGVAAVQPAAACCVPVLFPEPRGSAAAGGETSASIARLLPLFARVRFVRYVLPVPDDLPPAGTWQPGRSRRVNTPISILKKRKVQEDNKFVTFTAGAVSGLVADAVTHPIDTIRSPLGA